jgi:hypothetical protein
MVAPNHQLYFIPSTVFCILHELVFAGQRVVKERSNGVKAKDVNPMMYKKLKTNKKRSSSEIANQIDEQQNTTGTCN